MLHSRLTWLWNLSSRWCHVTVTHHSKQPHYYYTHTPHAFVRALTDLTFYLLCRDLGKSKPSCCFKSLLRVWLSVDFADWLRREWVSLCAAEQSVVQQLGSRATPSSVSRQRLNLNQAHRYIRELPAAMVNTALCGTGRRSHSSEPCSGP